MTDPDKIKQKLSDNAMAVDEAILELLAGNFPATIYDASKHLINAGGKRLRPYLVSKSCEVVGGNPADSIPFSAGLEILHNFTLVHDDIMDNDDLRRGVSTVHKKWNTSIAICAGDLLFAKVFEAMTELAPGHIPKSRILNCIEKTAKGTTLICEGQVMDILFSENMDISEEDYLVMVGKKTSALFKTCAEVGAIIGGGTTKQISALGEFAWNAGIAFQIIDDYLGAIAEEETLGKPIGSDLREGKRTLIVIHALKNSSEENKEKILATLGNERAGDYEVKEAINALEQSNSLEYALGKAHSYVEKAQSYIEIFPENDAKNDLVELVDYFIQRTY